MSPTPPARSRSPRGGLLPAGTLVLVLLPLLLLPLSAIFVFALRGGIPAFWKSLSEPDAQFALRFSLLVAFATAAINTVLGTFAAYVLSKYRFPGREALGIVVNLPVAIPTVVVVARNVAPGERALVDAFVAFLWSERAQRIFVAHGFRSVDDPLNRANPAFGTIAEPFHVADFGGWEAARRDVIDAVWKRRVHAELGQ